MISGKRANWFLGMVAMVALGVLGLRGAAETTANPRDTLVYKDGDRVQGTVVQKTSELIVFKSDRFGELRVNAADAVIIAADKSAQNKAAAAAKARSEPAGPSPTIQAATATAETAAERADEERVTLWDRFSPGVLTAHVRNFFGPWHGRLAFSTEVVNDAAERNNHSVEGRLTRKWTKDEVQLTARYDYAETNDVATTDVIKASGSWRHEFSKQWFGHYRPTAEWNHASRRQGVPNDYVLLQQELGLGVNVYTTASRKVRAGVSQNVFDIWNSAPQPDHTTRGVPSAFEEVELRLPWQMGLSQRGIWYPVNGDVDGWENRVELNKKLTETLSTSIRHEIRRNNPDGSAQDYTRLKLLFGLDF